jgi:hypothetical protein
MAKAQPLDREDLVPAKDRALNSTRQRGIVPSAELIPMQFRMPPDFVYAFKQEALNRRLKLNELLIESFDVFMKASKTPEGK